MRGARRPRLALPFVALAAVCLAAVACRGRNAGEGRDGAAQSSERQRVLAFWRELESATAARLQHGCAAAIPRYERALALDPRHEDALYYLGQCLRESHRPLEARSAFERLVAVNDSSARGHLALGALLASPDPAEPIDLVTAETQLRRVHAINGEETGPMVRLGELALAAGRPAEARSWFEAALRTNPRSVEAAFLAGFVAWDGGARDLASLVGRVAEAARVVAPVKGVLSEGDRRDARRVAAPPLASPLGRLLFEAPIAELRRRASIGEAPGQATVIALWRETRRLLKRVAARAAPDRNVRP